MDAFENVRQWGPTPNYPLVKAYTPPGFGYSDFVIIAGPCSVENKNQIIDLALKAQDLGATHLRGGVFRAGTYPGKSFGYVDKKLIENFHDAALLSSLSNIIEILDYSEPSFSEILEFADCVQVGARQMQNYTLLRKVGACGKPVFLKRHPGATMDEWLGAAEHVLASGCKEIYLVERGSSTNANHVRWDLSISMIPAVKNITRIPVIVDGSHGTGRWDLVEPMTLAGVAAGANGVLVEFHQTPSESISDPDQALTPEAFKILMNKVNKVREAIK